ncbi:MAG: hypothetical protein ABIP77_01360 [Candidatus Limnocylindrales bacterium]
MSIRSVHWQPADPGTHWVKDPGVVIDAPDASGEWKILTPNVVEVPSGGYRMYYTRSGPGRDYGPTPAVILSSFSPDGSQWQEEPGIRLAPHGPDASIRVVCPDVIPMDGGGYRMYFEGQPRDRASVILSAVSEDGLDWRPEAGVRFEGPRRYGSPRCLPVSDDPTAKIRYRLYFHSYSHRLRMGLDAGNHIVSAVSADGLSFEAEPGVRIGQEGELQTFAVYAPEVLRLGDGSFRMYYAGWQVDPVRGRIFSASSRDGVAWQRDPKVNLAFGGPYDAEKCSEPCVTRLPDGRHRMFYEACDEHAVWRILSATTVTD